MAAESPLVLETERCVLRLPAPSEARKIAEYFQRNRHHLDRWDPPRPEGFFSEPYWRHQLERNREDLAHGTAVRLFLEHRSAEGNPIGTVNFTAILRGAAYACHLGYGIDADYEGQGLMHEALQVALGYMFEAQHMHRIQASYLPTNERSGRLLRRLGFHPEGYARDYLFIAGAWRDHVLTAKINTAWHPEARSRHE